MCVSGVVLCPLLFACSYFCIWQATPSVASFCLSFRQAIYRHVSHSVRIIDVRLGKQLLCFKVQQPRWQSGCEHSCITVGSFVQVTILPVFTGFPSKYLDTSARSKWPEPVPKGQGEVRWQRSGFDSEICFFLSGKWLKSEVNESMQHAGRSNYELILSNTLGTLFFNEDVATTSALYRFLLRLTCG